MRRHIGLILYSQRLLQGGHLCSQRSVCPPDIQDLDYNPAEFLRNLRLRSHRKNLQCHVDIVFFSYCTLNRFFDEHHCLTLSLVLFFLLCGMSSRVRHSGSLLLRGSCLIWRNSCQVCNIVAHWRARCRARVSHKVTPPSGIGSADTLEAVRVSSCYSVSASSRSLCSSQLFDNDGVRTAPDSLSYCTRTRLSCASSPLYRCCPPMPEIRNSPVTGVRTRTSHRC